MNYFDENTVTALSPVDGRYAGQVRELSAYFSEYALTRFRLFVEVQYLQQLSGNGVIPANSDSANLATCLDALFNAFDVAEACQVKAIEREIRHDVKAVEMYLRQKLMAAGFSTAAEYVHFGLTSQDINNTAIPLSLRNFHSEVYRPLLADCIQAPLESAAQAWMPIAMLARTHGQPASPTRLGKELLVFVERIANQLELLDAVPFSAKFGGATGNFNSLHAAHPEIDWIGFADQFVNGVLGLKRLRHTTQIEHYDNLAAYLHGVMRINTILTDLCRDLWTYVSMDYFSQQVVRAEVGSSAMPHKVNPIDLENAEGNLGIANALLGHLASKLPVSRLQRDLTDYTSLRNLGVAFGHTVLAIKNIKAGFARLTPNQPVIHADLDRNWQVLSEGVQTILRRHGVPDAYDKMKHLFRTGAECDKDRFWHEVNRIEMPEAARAQIQGLSPQRYTGIVDQLS